MTPDERRRRIVAAAERVFTSKGYVHTSMDDVVRLCGMSKKTVYEMFDAKERLFREVVVASLEGAPRLDPATPAQSGEGRETLREVLREMAAFILSPRQVALTRLVLAEGPSTPELGAIYFETAVAQGQEVLAHAIRQVEGAPPRVGDQSGELADLLVGVLVGPYYLSALIGRSPLPTREETHARIDWTLGFLAPLIGLDVGDPSAPVPGRGA